MDLSVISYLDLQHGADESIADRSDIAPWAIESCLDMFPQWEDKWQPHTQVCWFSNFELLTILLENFGFDAEDTIIVKSELLILLSFEKLIGVCGHWHEILEDVVEKNQSWEVHVAILSFKWVLRDVDEQLDESKSLRRDDVNFICQPIILWFQQIIFWVLDLIDASSGTIVHEVLSKSLKDLMNLETSLRLASVKNLQ